MSDFPFAAFGTNRRRLHVGTYEWVEEGAMRDSVARCTPLCGAPWGRLVSSWDMVTTQTEIDRRADAGHLCPPCEAEYLIRTRGRDDIVARERERRERPRPRIVQQILAAEGRRHR